MVFNTDYTMVICYELTIRWALSMQKDYGFLHSTGTYGAFGTAIGIGRLLAFDEIFGLRPHEQKAITRLPL